LPPERPFWNGFAAKLDVEPPPPLVDEYEDEEYEEDWELWCELYCEPVLERVDGPRRPRARAWWSSTTDENGEPFLRALECPDATVSLNATAPAATETATARSRSVCAPKRRRRRCRKLATAAPSARNAGIREGSGMRAV
jgi:hypothetical protein